MHGVGNRILVYPEGVEEIDLHEVYQELNRECFDDFLLEPVLAWNSRIRSSAGRFTPGVRRGPFSRPPVIELALYLRDQPDARACVKDTLGHEMIHYWLWVRRKPYGHTPEFYEKMQAMGVSRYNTIGVRRPYKHMYICVQCGKDYPSRRVIPVRACGNCCDRYNAGKFHLRFQLQYSGAYLEVMQIREQALQNVQCSLGENPGASENPAVLA